MSQTSARLSLPFLQPAQAQKHVTVNEALERLDFLVQLSVVAFDALSPPSDAEDGQVWALGPMPTGDWAGEGGKLALRAGGGWEFIPPASGWCATRGTELRLYDGGDWRAPGPGSLQNVDGVGIRTSHDAANPLAVAGAGTLLSHDGAGHQLKINKAGDAATASLLFQTSWSGRAEIGTAGNDDLSFKVSADGMTWRDGLVVRSGDGAVKAPNGLIIEGQTAVHLGNLLGSATQHAGQPTGAVIERGETPTGSYLRLADGTQICMAVLEVGNPTALGAGSFADPYRTSAQSWIFPMPFATVPVVTGHATTLSAQADDRRMLFSSAPPSATEVAEVQASRLSGSAGSETCAIDVLAVGRWY